MAVDTPARIAIIGAGPLGLEATLYARFLGYDVDLYEAGDDVANHVRNWGHVRMFTPFRMNRSTLGLAALHAQDEHYEPPDDEAYLSGREWFEAYLERLAHTDLVGGSLLTGSRVVALSRHGTRKTDHAGTEARREASFRILLEADGKERCEEADIVIDATGTYGQPNWLGDGGIPAIGERAHAPDLQYRVPDVLGRDRQWYAGKHTVLVGSGYSAATTLESLAELAEQTPETRVTWIVRRPATRPPLVEIPDDPLPSRSDLARRANARAADPPEWLEYVSGHVIEQLERRNRNEGISWRLRIRDVGGPIGDDEEETAIPPTVRELDCDRIVAQVGYRGDTELFRELHVHLCYASEGPMRLAAQLAAQADDESGAAQDCLRQPTPPLDALIHPEPDFYVVGAKSYGRNPHFLFRLGLEQIRLVFSLIGDRQDLDLYAGAESLPR